MQESDYDRMMRQATSPEAIANIESYKSHTEKLAAEYRERERVAKDQFEKAKSKALATLSDKWQPIETAPRDGTHIIGLDWHYGINIANVYWSQDDGNWRMAWCPGYDMDMDELQPVRWMPI